MEWMRKCSAIKRGEAKSTKAAEKTGGIRNPLLLKEWDYDKNKKNPSQYSPNSNKSVWWICSLCGYNYPAVIENRALLDRGCPACTNKVVWKGHNDLATTHPRLAAEWHPDLNGDLKPDQVVYGTRTKVWWLCPEGHSYQASILHRAHGTNCPTCNSGRQTSFAEQAVYYYVKKVFPDAVSRYRDIFDNSMELDIYIPSIRLGIEYDGEAYHRKDKEARERKKWEICQKNGIKLLRLVEKLDKTRHAQADFALSIEGEMYEPKFLAQVIRTLLDEIDPVSNKWTRKHPQDYHSHVDIDIKRDETEIRRYMTNIKEGSLADSFPGIAAEWHPTKNGELTPNKVRPHSDIKVWWMCPECGKEYQASIGHRTDGTSCPDCAIRRNAARRCKKVQMIDITTQEVLKTFDSITEASKQLGISSGNISAVCKGLRRQASGYIWKYDDSIEPKE